MQNSDAMPAGSAPDPANQRAYRDALGRYATGVVVVTAREADGGGPLGITVNSFASVSLDPPLVLWSAARSSVRHAHFTKATAFAVHVLGADQANLAARFSRNGTDFSGLAFTLNEFGVPLLPDALARFECATETLHEGGDHTIILGRVSRYSVGHDGPPLVFTHGRYAQISVS
ncbi:flavin reductase family protein [Phaeovulum sp.]|uniref:flavin reductase family protein n=1 Tax=Phaeovulum sp. TaxID=2934796 RepID=UPI003567DBCD